MTNRNILEMIYVSYCFLYLMYFVVKKVLVDKNNNEIRMYDSKMAYATKSCRSISNCLFKVNK